MSLLLTGIYPSKNYRLWQRANKCFCLGVTCVQFLTMVIFMVLNIGDMTKISQTLQIFMTQIIVIIKLLTISENPRELLAIEDFLTDPDFYGFSSKCLAMLKDKVSSGNFGVRMFRFLCFTSVMFYSFFPFLDKNNQMTLPLPGWFPYDVSKYYYPTAFLQISTLLVSAYHNCNCDGVMWMLTTIAAGQFEMLKENLKNINYSSENKRSRKELVQCIVHHKKIILLVKSIESLFTIGIFMQFFSSIIIICMSGFQITVTPIASAQFLFIILYFACMMWQIGMYCWYGHDIMTTSNEIDRLFYLSNWYESEVKIRRIMIIFLEKTKKPVILTSGNLVTLSLVTLMNILRSSYSYFAVMRKMYEE